jgi:hypothetical protein
VRPVIALLLRLYPALWRARYGDEFATLLGARPLGPFDLADVLLGAIDAHLHLQGLGTYSEHRRGFPMSLRIGGKAATIGGALWFVGLAWSSADPADQDPGVMVFLVGVLALLVGLTGLSAFQARRHPTLVWAAFTLPALGGAMATIGVVLMATLPDDRPVVGGLSGWDFFMLGSLATVAGSILFAIATYRTGALPRSGALLLGIASTVALLSFAGSFALGEWLQAIFIAGFLAFPLGWVVLGLQAIRLDRPVMAAGPA